MMRKTWKTAFAVAALAMIGCGSDDPGELFPAKPECKGEEVTAFAGSNPQVISSLEIGSKEDGFDLDRDGEPDNKLAAVSDIARAPIADSLANYELIIPIEMFDLDALAEDSCVKFGMYLGSYVQDTDGDGKEPYVQNGDCNDKDMAIHRDAPEVAADFKDNDCDGLADENAQNAPSTDTMDRDGDMQSMADGDCDDNNAMVKLGAAEICGDGLDNDCDGTADRTGVETSTACSPFDPANPVDIPIDPLSLDGGKPLIAFKDGVVSNDGGFVLDAGPSVFGVNIPVADGIALELKITGATIQADLAQEGGSIVMKNGRLGGVLDAKTIDTIRGLSVDQIGLTPENSLLDATFANVLGPLLALPKATPKIQMKYENCRTPDIDVDQDGLEAYCDSNIEDMNKSVDVCIDGDGTEVLDIVDGAGMVTMHCTQAMNGTKARFVDGISVALKFATVPVKSLVQP